MDEGDAARQLRNIDPVLRTRLHLLPKIDLRDLDRSRATLLGNVPSLTDVAQKWDVEVSVDAVPRAPDEGPAVPVLLFRALERDTPSAALVWLHGGGFVLGSALQEADFCAEVASRFGITVVCVDYRLAPETPFPGAFDDAYSALEWIHRRSEQFLIDTDRIAVGGQSAGAGLAAAVALAARDRGGPKLCAQILEVPVLDDRLESASMIEFTETPVWTTTLASMSWQMYLSSTEPTAEVPSYAAPARATDLTRLPRAYLSAMELDPLRDECIDYACALLRCGVSAELHVYPGTFHRSSGLPAAVSTRVRTDVVEAVGRLTKRFE